MIFQEEELFKEEANEELKVIKTIGVAYISSAIPTNKQVVHPTERCRISQSHRSSTK